MLNIESLLRQNKGCEQALEDLIDYILSSGGDPGELSFLNECLLQTFAEVFIGELALNSVYIILTPGKAGSVTIQETFLGASSASDQLLIRTHIISKELLLKEASFIFSRRNMSKDLLMSSAMQLLIGNIANYLILGEGLEKFKIKLTVISVLRNDIDVSFAAIFQNWRNYFSSLEEINVASFEKALKRFLSNDNPYLLKNWYLTELLPIKVLAEDNTRIRLYVERYEKVFISDYSLHCFLSQFGMDNFRVRSDNIGSRKEYSGKYKEILASKSQILSRVLLDSPAIN